MVTQQQRDKTIQEHIKALTALSGVYRREFGIFYNIASRKRTDELGDFIFSSLPLLLSPFQRTSKSLGQRFLEIRGEQSGFTRLPDAEDFNSYNAFLDTNARSSSGLLKSMMIKQRDGYNVTNQEVFNAMERPIVDADRQVFQVVADAAPEIEDTKVGVRSAGCAFCKSQAVFYDGSYKFHNACRCTFDPQFDGDPDFKQDFFDEFEEQWAEAEREILNGNVEPVVLSVRSKGWEVETRQDLLSAGAREGEAETLLTKAMTKETFTGNDKATLSRLGLSEDELLSPKHKTVTNTPENILKVLENKGKS